MPRTIPEIYHNSMKQYGFGYGLYEPETSTRLQPGLCGYLDESGHWQPLLDITNSKNLLNDGFTVIGTLQRGDSVTRYWDPQVASTVEKVDIDLGIDGSALLAGLPLDASVAFKYKTSTNFGAVLMCDDKVVFDGYDHKDPFREWLRKNADKLLLHYPSLKTHGIYVATSTYSSSNIHINAWNSPKDEITVGFKVGATGIGGLGPSITWMRGNSTSGWKHYATEPGKRGVVFFGGIKMIFRKLTLGKSTIKEIPQSEWRGDGNKFNILDPEDHEQAYEVELETLGDDLQDID